MTPTELVELARAEGLSAVALTDHDTVEGLDEAADAAQRSGIGFVPGIELEVEWEPGVFHMLGLGLKRWHGSIRARLEQVRRYRKERNLKMVELLRNDGIPISYEELTEISGHDTVGRPHFARWLLHHGTVSSMQEAFDTMIGDGRPFYLRKRGMSVGRTCDVIHAAGGLAVLAHPQTLRMSWDDMAKSLKRWKGEGLDGIEAYHANLTCTDGHRLAALAEELGLHVTAGSDYHGPPRTDRRLGRSCDGVPIDDRFLEPIGVYENGSG
jgi:predicted metal-dependent phosphoesterase TrpH